MLQAPEGNLPSSRCACQVSPAQALKVGSSGSCPLCPTPAMLAASLGRCAGLTGSTEASLPCPCCPGHGLGDRTMLSLAREGRTCCWEPRLENHRQIRQREPVRWGSLATTGGKRCTCGSLCMALPVAERPGWSSWLHASRALAVGGIWGESQQKEDSLSLSSRPQQISGSVK